MRNASLLLPSALSLALLAVWSGGVQAQTLPSNVKQLNDVVVQGAKKKKVTRRDKDVTGLGKVVKSSDTIDKEQVLGIRDLVRYEPGVTVVEQGRGASSGYAIRGVDRNRVAVVVDGIPQSQSYVVQGNSASTAAGGAINEIENENITSIEISKGASASEYGNGAMGGAVGFRTKSPSDIIQDDNRWGVQGKTAYSSKNRQLTTSLGVAARHGRFEGLLQYTHKRGTSTQLHEDAPKSVNYRITRLGHYAHTHDLREADKRSGSWFVIEGEQCGDQPCEPRASMYTTTDHNLMGSRDPESLSAEEKAMFERSRHITENIAPQDYTGPHRVLPDPMTYRTHSWLAKLGVQLAPKHYLGATLEDTRQRYDIRDMRMKAYYEANDASAFKSGRGVYYLNGHPQDGIHTKDSIIDVPYGLRWTKTQFFDEFHTKQRQGLVYRFEGVNQAVDKLEVALDHQRTHLDVFTHRRFCAEYPTVDPTCRPTTETPWAHYSSGRNSYEEQHWLAKVEVAKVFTWGNSRHDAHASLGFDRYHSVLSRSDFRDEATLVKWVHLGGNGDYDNPHRYRNDGAEVIVRDLCEKDVSAYSACGPRHIRGYNAFVALRDTFTVGQYIDASLGARLDRHTFDADDNWTAKGQYNSFSWNAGLVVKPLKALSLSYRISNGFRAPSFQEMFGYRTPGFVNDGNNTLHTPPNLQPEKAFNQEFGLRLQGNFGAFEASYFRNTYMGLITLATRRGVAFDPYQFHNAQDVKLSGVNLSAKLDWNGITDKAPEGLYSTVAFNRVKPSAIVDRAHLKDIQSYVFDAVQPARIILGLGYDDPDERWGVNALFTYSQAKNPQEVQSLRVNNVTGKQQTLSSTTHTTRPWYVVDVIAHYKVHKAFTLRAGVYNLMNYRYTTWESLRQTARGAVNQQQNIGNYARFAAPGRNFTLSLEMKL